jgi:hypothetical protein
MVTTQVTAKSDTDSFLDDVSVPFWEVYNRSFSDIRGKFE